MQNWLYKRFLILAMVLLITPLQAADHQVQVGDLIMVELPGEPSFASPFMTDRDGRILLPEVGAIKVSGLTEEQLHISVEAKLEQAFRGLSSLNVYVYKRQLLISVQGYVNNPGDFTLPDDGSVQMALHAAGGLRTGAQLNRLKLTSNDETQTFDYKKYLDSGDPNSLPQLKSKDILFVPASPMIGNVEVEFDPAKVADGGDAAEDKKAVKVFGEVNSPGSFSYKSDMSLIDLLMRAGGVTRYAGVEQIRLITQGEPQLFNLKQYLDQGDSGLMPGISPGATIFIPKQEEEIKSGGNVVYVMGEVAKPGAFEGKEDATLMDILANAGGPTRFAESRQIRIIRASGKIVQFDLTQFTDGKFPGKLPAINAGDAIFVPEKTDMNEKSWLKITPDRAVRVFGEIVRPGRIEWSDEMTLLDLLAHVGGPTSRADTSSIEIVSASQTGKASSTIFNLDTFMRRGGQDEELPKITAGTTVRVHDLPSDPSDNKAQWVRQSSEKSIYIFGQVGAPGRYMFTPEMNFLDILSAADGPTDNADLRNIRISHHNQKYAKVSQLNLALYFESGDATMLPDVKTGDTIYVPAQNRAWLEKPKETTVRVLGAVNKPGRYSFDDTMTILDLLAEAGGTSATAYVNKITVANASCCESQARRFNLKKFSRTAKFEDLPVIRAGDTIYVPEKSDSIAEKLRAGLRDTFQIISVIALLAVL